MTLRKRSGDFFFFFQPPNAAFSLSSQLSQPHFMFVSLARMEVDFYLESTVPILWKLKQKWISSKLGGLN